MTDLQRVLRVIEQCFMTLFWSTNRGGHARLLSCFLALAEQ